MRYYHAAFLALIIIYNQRKTYALFRQINISSKKTERRHPRQKQFFPQKSQSSHIANPSLSCHRPPIRGPPHSKTSTQQTRPLASLFIFCIINSL
jgi:hypothetical protein